MAKSTVVQFAKELQIPVEALLEQLKLAGVTKKSADDALQEQDKTRLLEHLRKSHSNVESQNRITLTRKQTSEIRKSDATGKSRTIQVEVRKKRVFVKRDPQELLAQEEAEKAAAAQKAAEEAERLAADARAKEEIEAKRKAEEQAKAGEIVVETFQEPAAKAQKTDKVADTQSSKVGSTTDDVSGQTSKQADQIQKADFHEVLSDQPEGIVGVAEKTTMVEPVLAVINEEDDDGKKFKKPPLKSDKGKQVKPVVKAADNKRRPNLQNEWKKSTGNKGAYSKNKKGAKQQSDDRQQSQHSFNMPTEPIVREVLVPESITVSNLAQKMAVKATEVIKALMKMGMMVTINEVIDQETAMIVVEEMGHTAKASKMDDPDNFLSDEFLETDAELLPRPPVVTVMGHVDHGKTSLLDYIRKAKIAIGEAGGITQHIGAYHVVTPRGGMTFLDTPGHEAFTAMRARGAKATDIVILVVAADDGVMPQTVEAIHHAKAANVPLVVALNKMDKPDAKPDRVKQELVAHEVIPEEYGGDTMFIPVSAKTGVGIDDLLEAVLLQAEILELKAPIDAPAQGIIIESRLDKGRGAVATMLVTSGTLHKGDTLLAGPVFGRVRAMTNETGKHIQKAGPSMPVEIQGLQGVPDAGEEVYALTDEKKAREIALYRQGKYRDVRLTNQKSVTLGNLLDHMSDTGYQQLNLVVKTDVQGSQEALVQSLMKLSTDEVRVNVIHAGVGGITESDINLAVASSAVIIAFNARPDAAAKRLAQSSGIDIRFYTIIYDALDDVKAAMSGMLRPEEREAVIGLVEVRQVMKISKVGTVAGCYVLEGMVTRNAKVRVLRDHVVIAEDEIESLRRFKDDVKEVKQGFECGITLRNYADLKEGDQFEAYEIHEISRTL